VSARLPRAASSRYVAVDLDVGALSSLQACDSIVGYSSCYKRACRARLCEEKGKDIHGGEQEMRERSLVQESGNSEAPVPSSPFASITKRHTLTPTLRTRTQHSSNTRHTQVLRTI
jgi:hypothetical protein